MNDIRSNRLFKTVGVLLLVVLGSAGLFFGAASLMKYSGRWYVDEDETFYTSVASNQAIGNDVNSTYWHNTDLLETPKEFEEALGKNYAIRLNEVKNGKEVEIYDGLKNDTTSIQSYGVGKNVVAHLDFGISDKDSGELEDYKYVLYVGIQNPLVNDGSYLYNKYELYSLFQPYAFVAPGMTIVCALLILVILIYETCAIGHSKDEEGIHLTWFDKIPFDVLLVLLSPCMYILSVSFLPIASGFYNTSVSKRGFVFTMICFIIIVALLLYAYFMSFVVRIKSHTLIKNNLGVILLMKIYQPIKNAWIQFKQNYHESSKTFKRVIIFLVIAGILEILVMINMTEYYNLLICFILWILLILEFIGLGTMVKMNIDSKVLIDVAQNLADGNLDKRIPQDKLDKLNGPFYQHGNNLNSIGEGMQKAIQNELKSERMKAELITNVSHDIKTPLTSIINYVDLLSKETDEKKQKEYIEVIQRQSQRLKKLTEDVVEASKATSGNMQVNIETVSVNEILEQALAEYQERMDEKKLEVIQTVPNTNINVEADGRLLWRVLRNIFSNVSKYSKEDTRVYIDVKEDLGNVSITVKNTSKQELNISEEELMQRFVRGDASRHTEGSGLGLSIAQSLTELMGGSFKIHIDGDLFKEIIVLNSSTENEMFKS